MSFLGALAYADNYFHAFDDDDSSCHDYDDDDGDEKWYWNPHLRRLTKHPSARKIDCDAVCNITTTIVDSKDSDLLSYGRFVSVSSHFKDCYL